MGWTVARVSRLNELKALGWSGAKIGKDLGISRGAVLGKINRLKGYRPPYSYVPRPRKPTPAARTPLPLPDIPPIVGATTKPARLLTLLELTRHTCRWPSGDVGQPDFGFCGAAPSKGQPYCAKHCRDAQNPQAYRYALQRIRY
jgi:GcrA cell cycle regulator